MEYRYDPDSAVPAEHWLSLDESVRIHLAEDYHRRTKVRLENRRLHAIFHVVVENQVAMGDETEAEATLTRLLSEGLDCHDAIHAIGDVPVGHIHALQKGEVAGDPNETNYSGLRGLNASEWLEKWKSADL